MEAFIGRHGELLEAERKKRKGAGESKWQLAQLAVGLNESSGSTDEPLEVEQTLEATNSLLLILHLHEISPVIFRLKWKQQRLSLWSDALETNKEVHAANAQDPHQKPEGVSVAQLWCQKHKA